MFLTNWDRLEFSQRVNEPWNHSVQFRLDAHDPRVEALRELKRDFFVVIYRDDPVTGLRHQVYEGLHATSTEQVMMTGDIFFNIYGGGFTKLLERRVVIPLYGEDNVTKLGPIETIAKAFVYENMVAPATLYLTHVIPTIVTEEDNKEVGDLEVEEIYQFQIDPDRILPGLSVAPDQGRGEEVEVSANYIQLETVIKNCVGETYRFGIVRGSKLGKFVFDVRPIWGTDRRRNNPEGNPPAVFEMARENMALPIFSINHRLEKNYIYVGGEGSGKERVIVTVVDDSAVNESPWWRTEAFTSVSTADGSSLQLLTTGGREYLNKNKAKITLTFDVRQSTNSRWLRDWFLGDLVTTHYAGRDFDQEIKEISVIVTGGEAAQTTETVAVQMEQIN